MHIGPIELPRVVILDSNQYENPGIGGSEFFFIRLAIELSNLGADVTLICLGHELKVIDGRVTINSEISTLQSSRKLEHVLITSTSMYRKLFNQFKDFSRVILVSHHPHDGDLRAVSRKTRDFILVNLGEYQYLSNKLARVRSVVIPAMVSPARENLQSKKSTNIIGHISSLIPSKGFHHIAKSWRDIFNRCPYTKLEVVGSTSLYGRVPQHSHLPTSMGYGKRIERLLGQELSANYVSFLGRIPGSLDEVISRWRVAILNPTGLAEADPATIKDCMRAGIPVFAGYDYGLRFYLQAFPELRLTSPKNLERKVCSLLENPRLYSELRARISDFYSMLVKRNAWCSERWVMLINGLLEDRNRQELSKEMLRDYLWTESQIFKVKIQIRSWILFPILRLCLNLGLRAKLFLLRFRGDFL